MTIEIHSPHKDTTEPLINSIKKSVMELYHLDKTISRGEIYLLQARGESEKEKRCDIRLSVYKNTMFVSRRAPDYSVATRDAIKELKKMIKQKLRRKQAQKSALAVSIQ